MDSHKQMDANPRRERGVALYMTTIMLFLLIGMGALSIDLASMYVARNQSQQAADAAAMAGAKYFVESGCVTLGNCNAYEATSVARATEVAAQSFAGGQPVTVVGTPSFNLAQAQNPQMTVSVQSGPLNLYFLPALANLVNIFGVGAPAASKITVGGTATAEAYNPSGITGGPTYCTGCVRPWLIPNCDLGNNTVNNPLCPAGTAYGYFLNPGTNYGVASPGCGAGSVIGEPIQIALETQPTLYGALDDGTGAVGYQQSIITCNTSQLTCGAVVNTLPGTKQASTLPGIDNLLHLPINTAGAPPPAAIAPVGQDSFVLNSCPPQINAGADNPIVFSGIASAGSAIATSDSIVTAYIYNYTAPLSATVPQAVTIVGFAQIFVSQVDTNGDVEGYVLSVAGCGSAGGGGCGIGAGSGTSINGPSLIPVRLIAPSN